jgi:hypothetical protein
MGIHSITDSRGEPSGWSVKLFANISGSQEFLMQLVMEMPVLVDASTIYGDARERLQEAIVVISVDGLMPAFEHLKRIRASVIEPVPELNRKQYYEDFAIVLWRAYKDLMQRAPKMMEPEFGFLFQNDARFEAGLAEWIGKRPSMAGAAASYLRKQRSDWQNGLAEFRNYLEHKDETNPRAYAAFYEAAQAEKLFEAVWRTIADILAMLISLHLPTGTKPVEIPAEQRSQARPRRFCFTVQGIPPIAPAEESI